MKGYAGQKPLISLFDEMTSPTTNLPLSSMKVNASSHLTRPPAKVKALWYPAPWPWTVEVRPWKCQTVQKYGKYFLHLWVRFGSNAYKVESNKIPPLNGAINSSQWNQLCRFVSRIPLETMNETHGIMGLIKHNIHIYSKFQYTNTRTHL